METRSWMFMDKAPWGKGPWWGEPDKVQWTDRGSGLPCLARRGPWGQWCGYVAVEPEHPLYGLDSSDGCALRPEPCGEGCCAHTPERLLHVHGGVTFSGRCEDETEHGICHVPSAGEAADLWWYGWDAGHAGDSLPALGQAGLFPPAQYRTLAYVQAECAALALQLAARDWDARLASLRAARLI